MNTTQTRRRVTWLRALSIGIGVALAAPTLGAHAAPSAAPVPTTELKPAQLTRGADVALLRLEDGVVIDGGLRVPFDHTGEVLGKYGADYVIEVYADGNPDLHYVVRLKPDGTHPPLASRLTWGQAHLSPDASRLVVNRGTRVIVTSLAGDPTVTHEFPGRYLDVLDVSDSQVLVTTHQKKSTRLWDFTTDQGSRIDERAAYWGSLAHNRLAFYTGDPYRDGCSVLTTLPASDQPIWRSCRERIQAMSPDGSQFVTVHLLADGLGPHEAWVRTATGRLLADYDVSAWFGDLRWESGDALLLDAHATTWSAQVRCTVTTAREVSCERASRLTRTVMP